MVLTFKRPLRGIALLATVLAISPSHADEPPIEPPMPEGLATTFEQLTRYASAADPKSPFQQIQLTAVLEEPKASSTPALPSKSAPDKVPPAAQSPVMEPKPIEYHYHYHAPAIAPAQAPVMAAPQQPLAQQAVLVGNPAPIQAVQVSQQLPAEERKPGPIRLAIGNVVHRLERIDDTRYVSRVPRTRPSLSSSSATATHVITTTTTTPAVVQQPTTQAPVFAPAPPPPYASSQR